METRHIVGGPRGKAASRTTEANNQSINGVGKRANHPRESRHFEIQNAIPQRKRCNVTFYKQQRRIELTHRVLVPSHFEGAAAVLSTSM
eukprot:14703663-Heterocapsa_arctica.AAC.1